MNNYVVKLYARAYRDLDDIYAYIAEQFVKNYIITYRVLKKKKEVHVITVRYAPSNF